MTEVSIPRAVRKAIEDSTDADYVAPEVSRTRGLRTLTGMGQTRTDSMEQTASKLRLAEKKKCPKCGRKSALRKGQTDDVVTFCRWALEGKCDYVQMASWAKPKDVHPITMWEAECPRCDWASGLLHSQDEAIVALERHTNG